MNSDSAHRAAAFVCVAVFAVANGIFYLVVKRNLWQLIAVRGIWNSVAIRDVCSG